MLTAKFEGGSLYILLNRATLNDVGNAGRRALGEGVRDGAEKIRQRAVRNVSGYPVNQGGRSFVIRVRTGALKGALETEWPYGSEWAARVFVNGTHTSTTNIGGYPSKPVPVSRYAGSIEHGHKEVDLKKTMEGKIVPFFGARSLNAQGPYAETGLAAIGKSQYISRTPKPGTRSPLVYDRKRTASGGSYFISFRKVGKKGWIIPEAQPRPFMQAAAEGATAEVRRAIGSKVRAMLAER